MSKESGVSKQNSGGKSSYISIKDSNASLHVVGCVPTRKEKPEDSRLTAFLQAQKQKFEDEDSGELEDETQVLRAKNLERVEEMLQKAKEDLHERKENCSKEGTSSNKEVKVPYKSYHQANALEMLHKMEWLRNQNDHNQLGRSYTAGNNKNTAHMKMVLSLPLKRQDIDDYFSGTKQSKNKGKRKNKTETVISLEDLERRLLEAAAQPKPVRSHRRSASVPRQQTHVHPPPVPPGITCWQQKSGSELFPNVQTRPLTICGADRTEDELLTLAIEESMKTFEAEKDRFIDLNEANHMDHICLKRNNNAVIIKFPLPEPIENESWDPPEGMGQVGSLCLLEENKLTVTGQVKDNRENSTNRHDRQKPQLNKESKSMKMGGQKKDIPRNNDETNLATDRMDGSTGQYGTRENSQSKSDTWESGSCYKEHYMTSGYVGQPLSEHRVDTDTHDHDGDLNHNVRGEYEEGIWGPFKNDETWNRQQNDDRCGIKKRDQNQRNSVSDPCTNWGESKSHTYVPQDGNSRTQGQVDWNQKSDHYQNIWEHLSGSYRNKGESMTQSYMPEASDSQTQKPTDRNQEKGLFENQTFHDDHNPVPRNMKMRRSQNNKWEQENTESRNQNYTKDDKPVYCNDKVWETEKNNEWDREKKQGDCRVQRHDPMFQGARICKTEEGSSFGRDERLKIEVQTDLNKCIDRTQLPHDKNHNYCYSELPVEHFFNFEPVSLPNSPQDVAQVFATQIRDAHLHQTDSPPVDSSTTVPQFLHAASTFLPPVTSTAGVGHSTSILPATMGASMPPHTNNTACQVPYQAFQPSSQPVPTTDIQELFEAFVLEQQQRMMSMNHLLQMAVMNPTGLPSIQPDSKLQAQQTHSMQMMATLMNPLGGLPTSYNDLLLQNNALLNPCVAPPLLGMNQTFAPSNAPLQSEVSSSLMGIGSTMQTPIPNASINMNTAVSTSSDASTFILNHGNQTSSPLLMPSPFAIDPNGMTHQNYQSTHAQQPAVGNMNNMMQHLASGPYSQPFGARPTGVGTSSKMIFSKGRGRLIM